MNDETKTLQYIFQVSADTREKDEFDSKLKNTIRYIRETIIPGELKDYITEKGLDISTEENNNYLIDILSFQSSENEECRDSGTYIIIEILIGLATFIGKKLYDKFLSERIDALLEKIDKYIEKKIGQKFEKKDR